MDGADEVLYGPDEDDAWIIISKCCPNPRFLDHRFLESDI